MGAGCYYTHDNGEVAYWIEPDFNIEENEEFDEFQNTLDWECVYEHICDIMTKLGYCQRYMRNQRSKLNYENGLALIDFESTYSGEGLIIKIKEKEDSPHMMNLFNANFHKMEKKIAKALNKHYTLAFGTSGYTSARIKPGDLK